MKKVSILLFSCALLAGCASSRTIYVRMDSLTFQAKELSAWAWVQGEDATTIMLAKTADGATTATVSTAKTKRTHEALGTAAIGAAAGLAAGLMVP